MRTQISQSMRRLRQRAVACRSRIVCAFSSCAVRSTLLTSKCPSLFSIAIIPGWCSPYLASSSSSSRLVRHCRGTYLSRPVIMSDDECTERSDVVFKTGWRSWCKMGDAVWSSEWHAETSISPRKSTYIPNQNVKKWRVLNLEAETDHALDVGSTDCTRRRSRG